MRTKADTERYRALSDAPIVSDETQDLPTSQAEEERDWDALRSTNPNVAAWCRVGSTSIDLPVVQANGLDDIEYWLHHNFWGEASELGCACADPEFSVASQNIVVYAHHLSTEPEAMFTQLADAYEQDRFDGLGVMGWDTPDGCTRRLAPLCAANIDEGDGFFLSPEWRSAPLRDWLAAHAERSQAVASNYADLISSADISVTLVTCSSMLAGQPWRTTVTFCA